MSIDALRWRAKDVPVRKFHDGAFRVLAAWLDPGPYPRHHARAQERLRKEWPTLAIALEQLSAVIAPGAGEHTNGPQVYDDVVAQEAVALRNAYVMAQGKPAEDLASIPAKDLGPWLSAAHAARRIHA
ncbi:hypothetical protein SEA_VROOMVROOM_59 [Arthrobacter phage VroomVroom]|uniref:Uncharacterized protein n=1 Tax=Arthrobacter phage VroomVroom TaxID=3049371 RepID=A0AA49FAI2_9CAUD|nr:hypothetical protein SEA_VROOMVROOM_59 [Arthrobacter phage VroomVroom]